MIEQVITQMSFSVVECRCTEFSITEFGKQNTEEIPFDQYLFNLSILVTPQKEFKKISIELGTTITAKKNAHQVIATATSIHSFLIVNFQDMVITKDGKEMGIPENFVTLLLGIALSNFRGILAVKLADTKYSNAILPIIDVSKLIPKKQTMVG